MRPEIRERIERGAALLDEKAPGWREKIDPNVLSIESTCDCVVGQTFESHYSKGLDHLFPEEGGRQCNWTLERDCGFCSDDNTPARELTAAWLEYLGHVQLPQETPA